MTIRTRRLRLIGAIVGAGLSGIAVLVGWSSDASMLFLGGLVGIPTAAVLGWREAPLVRSQTSAARFSAAMRMALFAVLLGDALVSTVVAVGGAASQGPAILAGWALIGMLGLVFFGLPAFALAFVVLWPWTFVVRHLPRALVG